jgi:hypothetical protein
MTGFTTKSLSHSMTRFHFRGARRCKWLPVFPCRLDKKPACLNGFKDAATDPGEIRRLWAKSPGPLIGVPTGEITGVDILDIDPRSGGRSWYQENKPRLPETRAEMAAVGEPQEQWGAAVLIEAATRAGLPSREAARTVASGLAQGGGGDDRGNAARGIRR